MAIHETPLTIPTPALAEMIATQFCELIEGELF